MLASHPQVGGLLIGLHDLSRSLGADPRHPTSLLYARSKLVVDAKASGTVAVDMPGPGADDDFPREAAGARALGFDGKICRTAAQVRIANEVFDR